MIPSRRCVITNIQHNLTFFGCIFMLLSVFTLPACQPSQEAAESSASLDLQKVYHPAQELSTLFHDVQMSRIFPDGKTLVDAQPKDDPKLIEARYRENKNRADFDLRLFVEENFSLPPAALHFESKIALDMYTHIDSLWSHLRRPADTNYHSHSSLIPLPFPYVVPGGRFREIYYWDSYFTMQGLIYSQQAYLARDMVKNFAWLIDTIGHIPNGNRSYYLSRSQPPFFSSMVALLERHQLAQTAEFLPQLEKEYAFWMAGENELSTTHLRVVKMPDGAILNRYYDSLDEPRPESYREDIHTASQAKNPNKNQVFRDLRAAAESGWDFSSRWLTPYGELPSIRTTDIVPVDLNCLLFHMEQEISRQHAFLGNTLQAAEFAERAERRKQAIQHWLWDDLRGVYGDYSISEKNLTGIASLATVYPLYYSVATQEHAQRIAHTLHRDFLKDGGLVTTLQATGEQWDFPNGWPPLQWLAVIGLRHYEFNDLAQTVAERWLALNQKVFQGTGRMMEKYNVVDINAPAGGGEYPTQDGFGWTNGVVVGLQRIYPPAK